MEDYYMKFVYIYCLLSLLLLSSSFSYAQNATTQIERKIIEKALDNIEMYKSCITIGDAETESYMMDLFMNRSVPVYNDLLGITGKKDISISEYLKEQKANMVSPIIKICNITKDRIWEENGKWKVQFSFDKSLSYQNQCGINFNTHDFYGKMFRESLVLVYDDMRGECRIESIKGGIDSKNRLPEDYCILDSTDIKDGRLLYKHSDGSREKVSFNSFGQMLLTHGHERNQFLYPDADVVVRYNYKPECHLVSLSYKTYNWKIKPHYDIVLGEALSLKNALFFNDAKSKTNSFGIDVGYAFPSTSLLKWGLFTGFGVTNTTFDLIYQNSLYSFSTNQDVDGDTYNRFYSDLSLSQTTKIKEYTIPVYIDADCRFNQMFSLYVDLGLVLNVNTTREIDGFEGHVGEVYGIYPQYNDLYLDSNWGYNGFTKSLSLTKDNLCNSERLTVNSFTANLLAGFGFRVNIPSTPLAIDLGASYQKGLSDIVTVHDTSFLGQYNGNMIYNEVVDNSSTEHVHDLNEGAGNITCEAFKLNMGLIIKF